MEARGRRSPRLLLRVHSAEHLRHVSSQGSYCKLYVGNSEMTTGSHGRGSLKRFLSENSHAADGSSRVLKTKTQRNGRGGTAVWNEKFEIVLNDPSTEILSIRVKAVRLMTSTLIGACAVPLKHVGEESEDRWVNLYDNHKRPAGKMRLQLRLVPPSTASAVSHAERVSRERDLTLPPDAQQAAMGSDRGGWNKTTFDLNSSFHSDSNGARPPPRRSISHVVISRHDGARSSAFTAPTSESVSSEPGSGDRGSAPTQARTTSISMQPGQDAYNRSESTPAMSVVMSQRSIRSTDWGTSIGEDSSEMSMSFSRRSRSTDWGTSIAESTPEMNEEASQRSMQSMGSMRSTDWGTSISENTPDMNDQASQRSMRSTDWGTSVVESEDFGSQRSMRWGSSIASLDRETYAVSKSITRDSYINEDEFDEPGPISEVLTPEMDSEPTPESTPTPVVTKETKDEKDERSPRTTNNTTTSSEEEEEEQGDMTLEFDFDTQDMRMSTRPSNLTSRGMSSSRSFSASSLKRESSIAMLKRESSVASVRPSVAAYVDTDGEESDEDSDNPPEDDEMDPDRGVEFPRVALRATVTKLLGRNSVNVVMDEDDEEEEDSDDDVVPMLDFMLDDDDDFFYAPDGKVRRRSSAASQTNP